MLTTCSGREREIQEVKLVRVVGVVKALTLVYFGRVAYGTSQDFVSVFICSLGII